MFSHIGPKDFQHTQELKDFRVTEWWQSGWSQTWVPLACSLSSPRRLPPHLLFVCDSVAVVWLASTPTLACQRSECTMGYPGADGCFNNCGKWGIYRCMIQAPTSKVLNRNPPEIRSNTTEHNATFCMTAQRYYKSVCAVFGKVTLPGNRCPAFIWNLCAVCRR